MKKSSTVDLKWVKLGTVSLVIVVMAFLLVDPAYAESKNTFGGVAERITKSFGGIARLIIGISYVAGLGFAIGAIMKFKQHKDNPTQIPVGTPIALIFIAAALLFLPSILGVTGESIFENPQVGGPEGTIFTTGTGGSTQ